MLPAETRTGVNVGCHDDLSDFKRRGGRIYFPQHYYEDYFIDILEDLEIPVDTKTWSVADTPGMFDLLHKIRSEAYSAANWYEPLQNFTYKSKLIPIDTDFRSALISVTYPAFIKLDSVSAKDTHHSGVFRDADEAVKVFAESARIQNTLRVAPVSRDTHYLFVREIDDKIEEYPQMRCFVHASRLNAVSCVEPLTRDQKTVVENYMKRVIAELPFQNACVDIVLRPDGPRVIEVNNFGADSPAGAELYNWKEDYIVLHGGSLEVDWRHKKDYEF